MTNAAAVVLPAGHSGSTLFHSVLSDVAARFPEVFACASLPCSASAFKREYGTALPRFEAARVSSPERVRIAREILAQTQQALRFGSPHSSVPLSDYLREVAPTPELATREGADRRGLALELPFEGRSYRGAAVRQVLDRLRDDHQLSAAAHAALHWTVDHALSRGGRLDLSGERFVLFGAGAELSSTELLLRAGANVLWIDLAAPPTPSAGVITYAPGVGDLLAQPREIAAAVRAFASEGPVHVGMFAYAPGASKEWRLGAAMNAIVASLPSSLIRSLSMLISPTTPALLSPETLASAELRQRCASSWQRWLSRGGVTIEPGAHRQGEVSISMSTVSLQGLSYQAAQYISKLAAAETYAVYGTGAGPLTVSANVAGVTKTRSLSHPLFDAAFLGAAQFGVRIFEPATTRALSGLLMLHDLLNPAAAGAQAVQPADPRHKASALLAQQVHGGIYGLPWALEGVIRVAAVVGLASRPSLLLKKDRQAQPALAPAE